MSYLWFTVLLFSLAQFPSQEVSGQEFAEFRSRELSCVIGNNVATVEHRRGYNGIYRLVSIHESENLFVPAYAGLNLEHVFDGSSRGNDREVFFEPRLSPMALTKIDARTAELHQPPTPTWQVETTTRLQLVDPYYIDVTVRCVPHRNHFQGGAFGLFWASYMNGPLDKSIYFLRDEDGRVAWQQFSTQYHNHDSTVKHKDDPFTWEFAHDARESLFSSISRVRFGDAFFYGRFRDMVWIVVFDSPVGIRFAHSPSGGGWNEAGQDTYPAWDFQWVIPDPEAGREYEMRYRAVYKLWEGRADVLEEVSRYRTRTR